MVSRCFNADRIEMSLCATFSVIFNAMTPMSVALITICILMRWSLARQFTRTNLRDDALSVFTFQSWETCPICQRNTTTLFRRSFETSRRIATTMHTGTYDEPEVTLVSVASDRYQSLNTDKGITMQVR